MKYMTGNEFYDNYRNNRNEFICPEKIRSFNAEKYAEQQMNARMLLEAGKKRNLYIVMPVALKGKI